jgi:acid phosphatase type 7
MTCEAQIQQMYNTWTNETTVAEILAEMQNNCKAYPYLQQEVCDKLAEIFVQIPPALFGGMDDLSWPVPDAMCALLMKCKENCCAADAAPEQVHLSFAAKDRSQMAVTWVTLNVSSSFVQYGTSADDLSTHVTGSIDTYTASGWVGTIHRAVMVGLKPSTTYFYRVGDPAATANPWSEVFSFTTLTPGQTMTYAVLADMDYGEASDGTVSDLINLVDTGAIQAVIHSGDISYADGYEPHWDVFFNKIQPIASRIPYMVTPGNHEFWFNFTSYKHRFSMPGVFGETSSGGLKPDFSGGSGDNMYYAWEVENVHFLALDSESIIDTAYFSDVEIDWMQRDLVGVDREATPWVIAHFHRPSYCSNDHACLQDDGGHGGAQYVQHMTEHIFHQHKVDLVLMGHVHSYQRTYPVFNNTATAKDYVSPAAPVYILQGASGNREGNKGSYPPEDEMPDWSAAAHTDVGYALMTVTANTLDWKFYASTVLAADSTNPTGKKIVKSSPVLVDQMTITK